MLPQDCIAVAPHLKSCHLPPLPPVQVTPATSDVPPLVLPAFTCPHVSHQDPCSCHMRQDDVPDVNNNNNSSSHDQKGVSVPKNESTKKLGTGWFTPRQTAILSRAYAEHLGTSNPRSQPTPKTKWTLASKTGLSYGAVTRWFQRRRRRSLSIGQELLERAFSAGGVRAPCLEEASRMGRVLGWPREEVEEWFAKRRRRDMDRSIASALKDIFGGPERTMQE